MLNNEECTPLIGISNSAWCVPTFKFNLKSTFTSSLIFHHQHWAQTCRAVKTPPPGYLEAMLD